MNKLKIVLLSILILGVVFSIYFTFKVKTFNAYMDQLQIENVDLSRVADGTYTGISDSGVIRVQVEVDVVNHEFANIRLLEHKNGQGENAEAILGRIISEQRTDVDAIAGATLSSRVIADAVQKAVR